MPLLFGLHGSLLRVEPKETNVSFDMTMLSRERAESEIHLNVKDGSAQTLGIQSGFVSVHHSRLLMPDWDEVRGSTLVIFDKDTQIAYVQHAKLYP